MTSVACAAMRKYTFVEHILAMLLEKNRVQNSSFRLTFVSVRSVTALSEPN
jgi:hypothetical protein